MSTSQTPDDAVAPPSGPSVEPVGATSPSVEPVETPTPPSVEPVHTPTPPSVEPTPPTVEPVETPTAPPPPETVAHADTADTAEAFPAYPGGEAFPGYGPATYGEAPPEAERTESGATVCPRCRSAIEDWASFCESCGQTLTPTAPMPRGGTPTEGSTPTRPVRRGGGSTPQHPCAECGGRIGDDLYCEQCGAKAPSPRDHFREAPAEWVAGVCDRGIKHHRNEDAMALAADADPEQGRAVLVVCDGVSNSDDSHLVSLPAARAARDILSERATVDAEAFTDAVASANEAVLENTSTESLSPGSCTFAGAVVEGGTVTYGNIGDARVYWIDDQPGASQLLSTDDSVAQARIAMGVDRHTAENGPQAHAITRWLGRDAPDLVPTTGSIPVPGRGWVLVCSDGLWNYASEPEHLHDLATEALTRNPGNQRVTSLAVSLVRWARHQGGKDNITVALARLGDFSRWPDGSSPPTAPATPDVPVDDAPAP